ncbi:MAG: DedA family protein [Actinomycetota bacterium]|nr:DedA family protein [Actinomycetota bacterium]
MLGDTVGYEVGRRYGDRLLARAPRRLVRPEAVERARLVIVRRGGPAVLVGRFTAALRTLVPGIAGTSRMPYRTFAAWNVAGGVLWGPAFSVLGFLAGRSYRLLERRVGLAGGVLAALAVIAVVVVLVVRRHRARPPAAG